MGYTVQGGTVATWNNSQAQRFQAKQITAADCAGNVEAGSISGAASEKAAADLGSSRLEST